VHGDGSYCVNWWDDVDWGTVSEGIAALAGVAAFVAALAAWSYARSQNEAQQRWVNAELADREARIRGPGVDRDRHLVSDLDTGHHHAA
jgi:hypothetical protein